jgi:excisionase family DNA binding protein
MKNKLLSTTEVAKILNISRIAVFKKIAKGQLKAQKIGNRYLISSDQIGLSHGKLNAKGKASIRKMVARVLDEYGDVIRKLGNE